MSLQGTDQWLAQRRGHLTGSKMADAMSLLKDGRESAKRRALKIEMIAERLTNMSIDRYVSKEMAWGTAHEPVARSEYEVRTGRLVEEVGFVKHEHIEWFGASPDGLVDEHGMVEIKCPNTTTHLEYIAADGVPDQYRYQMLVELACTGRRWVDFVSFDPRLPYPLDMLVRRFHPERKEIEAVETQARQFLDEVQELLDEITFKHGEVASDDDGPEGGPGVPGESSETDTPGVRGVGAVDLAGREDHQPDRGLGGGADSGGRDAPLQDREEAQPELRDEGVVVSGPAGSPAVDAGVCSVADVQDAVGGSGGKRGADRDAGEDASQPARRRRSEQRRTGA